MQKRETGVLPITDRRMTRFNITLQQGVDFVLQCLERMWGGELFVPKIPSYRILDVAEAVDPECKQNIVGIRPGEKMHELLLNEYEIKYSIESNGVYILLPSNYVNMGHIRKMYPNSKSLGLQVYSSDNVPHISKNDLKKILIKHKFKI